MKVMKITKQYTRPEHKDISSARETDMAIVSCQAIHTKRLEKFVSLLLFPTKENKLSVVELMELQNIIDVMLNDIISYQIGKGFQI